MADAPPDPAGKWLAEDIAGGGVIDRLQTTLEIEGTGAFGKGGCNRYGSTVKIDGDRLTFTPAVSTRMACAPAIMEQERKFLDALGKVRGWETARSKLVLLDGSGKPVLTFSPLD
ncbi:MAG: META domain-containing protein [Phyllobacterium sp.]